MSRELTPAAMAAKAIKKELQVKYPGVKFSVKSSNYSMGDSVNINYIDGPLSSDVDNITSKYQYGHFNGMEDMYENTNSRDDIPQSKFVMVNRKMSKEVGDVLLKHFQDTMSHCEGVEMNDYIPELQTYMSQMVYREFIKKDCYERAEVSVPTEAVSVGEFEIIKHTHTQKGHDLWAVKMVDRVSREKFMELLSKAKSMDGYYSSYRRDGAIPGFQFKTEQGANDFTGTSSPGTETTITIIPVKKVSNNEATADKWQKLADSYKKESDKKFSELENAQSNTPKRMREYNSKNIDAHILQEAASMAQGLADAYRNDKVPDELKVLQPAKSKGHLLHFIPGHDSGGYYDAHRSSVPRYKQHGGTVPSMDGVTSAEQADKILELLNGIDNLDAGEKAERERLDKIKRLEDEFRFQKIPGFFPTPSELGRDMVGKLNITNGQTICEPGAGLGHLAEEVREAYPDNKLTTIELSFSLSEILLLKGFKNMNRDFLSVKEKFDRIIMNPPFEKGQDIDHVRHAHSLLKEDGRLVSIMGSGAFQNSTKKHQEFQEWIDEMGADYEQLPEGSFKNAFKSTGINTYLIVIDK